MGVPGLCLFVCGCKIGPPELGWPPNELSERLAMHPLYADQVGTWDEPLPVTINGVVYPSQLYNGVQRFVPDRSVELRFARGAVDLNRLALRTIQKSYPLEKYIDLLAKSAYSVCGFESSVSQLIENNPHAWPGELEDYFLLHNPLWEMSQEEMDAKLAPKLLSPAELSAKVTEVVARQRVAGHLSLSSAMAELKALGDCVDQKAAVSMVRAALEAPSTRV